MWAWSLRPSWMLSLGKVPSDSTSEVPSTLQVSYAGVFVSEPPFKPPSNLSVAMLMMLSNPNMSLFWFSCFALSLIYLSTGRKPFDANLVWSCLQHLRVLLDCFEYVPLLFMFMFFNAVICAFWRACVNLFSSVSSSMSEEWMVGDTKTLITFILIIMEFPNSRSDMKIWVEIGQLWIQVCQWNCLGWCSCNHKSFFWWHQMDSLSTSSWFVWTHF